MKKKLAYTLLIILTLLLVTYLLRYKLALSYKNRIPKTATSIININARQLEHHILMDFITYPTAYFKSKSDSKKDSIKKPNFGLTKGVKIPRNILLYTINDTATWYSSIFDISDKEILTNFLKSEKFTISEQDSLTFFTKKNIVFGIKGEQLIIALNFITNKNTAKTFAAIFTETQFLDTASPLLKPIINSNADICFNSSDKHFIETNFSNGQLTINGQLSPEFDLFNEMTSDSEITSKVAFSGFNINKNSSIYTNFKSKSDFSKLDRLLHLSSDSILDKWNGNFSLNLKSITNKTDTIITYKYDDDFNKIEVKSTQKTVFPDLEIQIGKNTTKDLFQYFETHKAIQVVDNDSVFVKIPLFKTLINNTSKQINLYTIKKSMASKTKSSKFQLFFNLGKYQKNNLNLSLIPSNNKLINLIKNLNINISTNNKLSAEIPFLDAKRNVLAQVVTE
jgi:hypothetical protein